MLPRDPDAIPDRGDRRNAGADDPRHGRLDPSPFLVVLGFWLAVMFASFGLFARANATVVAALLAGASSVAGAVFLILELDRPLDGLMRLSTEPIRRAVEMVGR